LTPSTLQAKGITTTSCLLIQKSTVLFSRRERIGNSQIGGILNQEPITKMVEKRELRWFGLLITMGEA
jgi:hypothetical protein